MCGGFVGQDRREDTARGAIGQRLSRSTRTRGVGSREVSLGSPRPRASPQTGAIPARQYGDATAAIKLDAPDENWYNGPPYAVREEAFDEYDMEGCSLEPDADAGDERPER
jgi:hypothetical protein